MSGAGGGFKWDMPGISEATANTPVNFGSVNAISKGLGLPAKSGVYILGGIAVLIFFLLITRKKK